jgi:hypothetical protein
MHIIIIPWVYLSFSSEYSFGPEDQGPDRWTLRALHGTGTINLVIEKITRGNWLAMSQITVQ